MCIRDSQYADLEKKVEDIHSSYERTGADLKVVEAQLRKVQPLIKNISTYQMCIRDRDNRYLYDILTEGKYPERIPMEMCIRDRIRRIMFSPSFLFSEDIFPDPGQPISLARAL